jgi:hypothetical protein
VVVAAEVVVVVVAVVVVMNIGVVVCCTGLVGKKAENRRKFKTSGNIIFTSFLYIKF